MICHVLFPFWFYCGQTTRSHLIWDLAFSESFRRSHSWGGLISVDQWERTWPRWLSLIGGEAPECLTAGTTVPRLLITPLCWRRTEGSVRSLKDTVSSSRTNLDIHNNQQYCVKHFRRNGIEGRADVFSTVRHHPCCLPRHLPRSLLQLRRCPAR